MKLHEWLNERRVLVDNPLFGSKWVDRGEDSASLSVVDFGLKEVEIMVEDSAPTLTTGYTWESFTEAALTELGLALRSVAQAHREWPGATAAPITTCHLGVAICSCV